MKKNILFLNILLCLVVYSPGDLLAAAPFENRDLMEAAGLAVVGQMAAETPLGLLTLQQYQDEKHWLRFDIAKITQFLNEQVLSFGLNVNDFKYFVGDDWADWAVVPVGNKYGLVLPRRTSSLTDLIKNMFGYSSSLTPQNALNVDSLNEQLKINGFSTDTALYNRYRLAIRKALIEAVNKKILRGVTLAAGMAVINRVAASLNSPVKYALMALDNIYPYVLGDADWKILQRDIDRNVLESNDIDFIKARIEDLEQQLKEEKASSVNKIYGYLPSAFSREKSALEKRLDFIKQYVDDNKFELENIGKFKNKNMATNKKL